MAALMRLIPAIGAAILAACASDSGAAVAAPGTAAPEAVRVVMETSAGVIALEVYPDKAPATAANFLRYVDEGLYDGAAFYRATRPDNDPMIEVVQAGLWDPRKEGAEGYDFKAPHAPIAHETTQATGLSHVDGAISMARVEPGTAASEIFISVGPNPELDFGGARNPDGQGFAAFGRVVSGMETVRAINQRPTEEGEGFNGQLLKEPVSIISVRRQ
jgi:peptidyl-prolyl cis-trans isomerase A (cyclophilin A)